MLYFFFHGNPNFTVVALILYSVFKLTGVAVHFHINAGCDFIVRICGKPMRKDLLVQSLEGLGHFPGAGEHSQVWAGMVRVVKPSGISVAGL